MATNGLNWPKWPQQAKYGLNSNGLKWPHMAFDKKLSFFLLFFFQFSNWVQKIKFSKFLQKLTFWRKMRISNSVSSQKQVKITAHVNLSNGSTGNICVDV